MYKLNLALLIMLTICNSALANDKFNNYSLYFLGFAKHAEPEIADREGSMALFGISRDINLRGWTLETGAATFIDTYNLRSYQVFSNVSHKRFTYRNWKPMLSLTCTYKGREHESSYRERICAPVPKVRVGKDKKYFANITLIPKYKDLTQGFAGIEVGYKF